MQKGLFITVNYGNADMTIDLLDNLLNLSEIESFEIAVVDNSQSDNDFAKLYEFKQKQTKQNIHIFKTKKNLGYFGAANLVINYFIDSFTVFDFIIISNNDIEIKDKEFFKKLNNISEYPGLIAPDIISTKTNRHQNPHRINAVTNWQKIQYRILYSNYYIAWILYYFRKLFKTLFRISQREEKPEPRNIFSAHGAFMIFTKKYFEKGGIIEDSFFLYGEEDSVAAQCAANNMKIFFMPELTVYHHENVSTDSSGFKKSIYQLQKQAYYYIKKQYHGFY